MEFLGVQDFLIAKICVASIIKIWFIIGVLQALGRTFMYLGQQGEGEVCLKLIPWVTPLNAGKLKVLEGTHGSDPMGFWGGLVVLERHTTPKK